MNSVLIIDDEEKIRALLARIIGLEGFELCEAANGKTELIHFFFIIPVRTRKMFPLKW